jgi:hypothetical protein
MSGREAVYGFLALLGLIIPSAFNAQYVSQGGRFYDIMEFLKLGFVNPASSSLTADLIVAFTAFAIWAVPESRRIGMRRGWIYPVLGVFIAFAFAFPLFLLQRERHLRRLTSA